MATIRERFSNAWNAFTNKESDYSQMYEHNEYDSSSYGSYNNPYRHRLNSMNDRSIVNAIYNRIAIDSSAISVKHIKMDNNGNYIETIDSKLNYCLSEQANKDQTARDFIRDCVISLLDEGVIAIVPVDTVYNPRETESYKINSIRVGKIVEWFPNNVLVNLYDDREGQKKDILLPKSVVAIVENPLYYIMNERNSTLRRLIRKLNLLDVIDDQSGSGKMNLLIKVPYMVKTPAKQELVSQRKKEIENQLENSKYGIAYIDSSESVTQLNRAVDNNLMEQINYLTRMLYSQLGIDETIMSGLASEEAMLNYQTRTIEPIISAIVDGMRIKFLTKTARTQKQSIAFFQNQFKMVPMTKLPEIVNTFSRNEILSSNEVRQIIGYLPSDDKRANELRNKNMPDYAERQKALGKSVGNEEEELGEGDNQNGV